MFIKAIPTEAASLVENRWGHPFRLPRMAADHDRPVRIGLLGTRTRNKVASKTGCGKTQIMAEMLAGLDCPLYLLDVRRNGEGAHGSWSPREFASIIPHAIGHTAPYDFVHLPCVAPSVELLKDGKTLPWREFRSRYVAELTDDGVSVAQAFVEAAAVGDGLAIFICAEEDHPEFDALEPDAQDACYCHRFSLARIVADRIRAERPSADIRLVHLDLFDFQEQMKAEGQYTPREEPL